MGCYFIAVKVCNCANPTQVGFVHMYEPCFLVTRDAVLRDAQSGTSRSGSWERGCSQVFDESETGFTIREDTELNESLKATSIIKSLISLQFTFYSTSVG